MGVIAGVFFVLTNLYAQFPVPQIDCKITNCLNFVGQKAKPAVCDVSNGELIEIHIELNTIAFNPLVYPTLNPNPIPPEGEYLRLKVVRESDGAEMPVRINKSGGGKNLNYTRELLYLEIPEAKEIRRAKAQTAWNKAKRQYNTVNHWGVKDANMVDGLEQDLVENQLGHFKIICSYISNKPGTWNGQVSSTPITIDVVAKGTSLDKLSNP